MNCPICDTPDLVIGKQEVDFGFRDCWIYYAYCTKEDLFIVRATEELVLQEVERLVARRRLWLTSSEYEL